MRIPNFVEEAKNFIVTTLTHPLTAKRIVQYTPYVTKGLYVSAGMAGILLTYLILPKIYRFFAPKESLVHRELEIIPPEKQEAENPPSLDLQPPLLIPVLPLSPPSESPSQEKQEDENPLPSLDLQPPLVIPAPPPSPPSESSPLFSAQLPVPTLPTRVIDFVRRSVVSYRHATKWLKYRIFLNTLKETIPVEVRNSSEDDQGLREILSSPSEFESPDQQYRTFIMALRESERTPLSSHLAYTRFAGVKMYDYCSNIIETITGPLPEIISINTFEQELRQRNSLLDALPKEQSMPGAVRVWKKFKGFINIRFDPLLESNMPYVAGQFRWSERAILILRHGVPVIHHDVGGGIARLVSWVPLVNRLFSKAVLSRPPEITEDYTAFIERALELRQNILHVIFENGKEAMLGDESDRVKVRLSLERYSNFFPVALRLDGTFFKPVRGFADHEPFTELKRRFKEHIFGSLETTGFQVPDKIASVLREKFDDLLDEVRNLYFPSEVYIHNLEEHQSFILFSYAHIVLFLCGRLDISILEAACKDDIDRGNTFKAILKLHFLYITHQINSENLKKILVNVLAPPLIVKKQAIIPSREIYLHHVLPILRTAFERCPLPQIRTIPGIRENPSYHVFNTQNSGFLLRGSIVATLSEYKEFLDSLKKEAWWGLPKLQKNLVKEISRQPPFYVEESVNKEAIKAQVNKDAHRLQIQCGDKLISSSATACDEIALFLLNHGIPEDEAWEILCSIQQGFSSEIFSSLHNLFNSRDLQFHFVEDKDAMMKNLEPKIKLDVWDRKAEIGFTAFFKVVDSKNQTQCCIKGITHIPDHRGEEVQFRFSVIN